MCKKWKAQNVPEEILMKQAIFEAEMITDPKKLYEQMMPLFFSRNKVFSNLHPKILISNI